MGAVPGGAGDRLLHPVLEQGAIGQSGERIVVGKMLDTRFRRLAGADIFKKAEDKGQLAIDLYVAHHNIDPKPFIWTASATDILAKVTRAKAALAAAAG